MWKWNEICHTKKNDLQVIRNESQVLRNESQVLRSESQVLRSEPQALRNESHVLRNESQVLRNELKTPRNKSHMLRSESQVLKSESKALRSDHHRVYTEEVNKMVLSSNDKNILDKINNKIDTINELNKGLTKIKVEVTKRIELIYESMYELQAEICSDDSWLRLVELGKIDAIIVEALNVVWNIICGENRICPEEIKIDKNKDIDGYVSILTDGINNKIELVNKMGGVIDHAMSEIKNETNMIDEKIHKASEMDNDTRHLIND